MGSTTSSFFLKISLQYSLLDFIKNHFVDTVWSLNAFVINFKIKRIQKSFIKFRIKTTESYKNYYSCHKNSPGMQKQSLNWLSSHNNRLNLSLKYLILWRNARRINLITNRITLTTNIFGSLKSLTNWRISWNSIFRIRHGTTMEKKECRMFRSDTAYLLYLRQQKSLPSKEGE